MGTFEKLGILVIVVIIVMILAVAIYQWGGTATEVVAGAGEVPDTLTVRNIDELAGDGAPRPDVSGDVDLDSSGSWPGGIPKTYVIAENDKVWVLVVKRWGLKESFVDAIATANHGVDMKRLRPGQALAIPDPARYRRGSASEAAPAARTGVRRYEVQIGDTLESIAKEHLGARSRWRDIASLNPGLRPKRLQEGQTILLPLR